MNLANALSEIETWPLADQVELVHRVWERIVESGWQPQLTEEQKAELDRRMAAHEANPNEALTWDSIVAHVRRER